MKTTHLKLAGEHLAFEGGSLDPRWVVGRKQLADQLSPHTSTMWQCMGQIRDAEMRQARDVVCVSLQHASSLHQNHIPFFTPNNASFLSITKKSISCHLFVSPSHSTRTFPLSVSVRRCCRSPTADLSMSFLQCRLQFSPGMAEDSSPNQNVCVFVSCCLLHLLISAPFVCAVQGLPN